MGVYKAWFCPERKEFLEQGNNKLHGYEYPDHAGAIVYCLAHRWCGLNVIQMNDSAHQDRYYEMGEKAEAEKWVNVWEEIWAEWVHERQNYDLWSSYGQESWNQVARPKARLKIEKTP